jgi:GNAT superfamily N-acetyltransferase
MIDGYDLRTDLADMDLDRVHEWLSTDAYWALGRTRDNVDTAARNSLNYGVFRAGEQVAYARVVTDHANFAWLCDVYVDRDHRGRGLGRLMVEAVIARLDELGVRRTLLATGTAHGVYEPLGFTPLPDPSMWMVRATPR